VWSSRNVSADYFSRSGYNLNGGQPGRVTGICQSPLKAGQAITYTAQNVNSTWISTSLTIASATSINAVAMEGWNVAVETSVTSTATAIATITSTRSPSSTPTLQSASSGGLSTGAKAGTGIALAALVIGILILVFFFVRRVRKRRQIPYATNNPAATPYEVGAGDVHEIGQKHEPVYEVQQKGSPVYEMHQGQVQGYGEGGGYGHTPVELESR
jgi:hypothetical protein